jgi:hypothetical protein
MKRLDLERLYSNKKDIEKIINLAFPQRKNYFTEEMHKSARYVTNEIRNLGLVRQNEELQFDLGADFGLIFGISENGFVVYKNWGDCKFLFENPLEIYQILLKYLIE